ncbi:MAG: phospho-sugar mutase [Lentisphaerae bacterium]|jgi:phosphoglucomutase|nr:phospho-sugar mutase [Lentisphaerota bacterium]MBT4818914.1 phospho-sugar mutase [Lentisphaerota bacterium]MBT5612677.1 phospho-sugar mutase [Lentisphaerota bacterium]MBT7056939.1 phospho-sugar mutase [Lentisphaerota bacterium]MBT7841532.1 phospho-sugar mutase [Lentisphaerota bacterium]
MNDIDPRLSAICERLEERYPEDGPAAVERLQLWLSGELFSSCEAQLSQHLTERHLDLLFDAFWQVLPFGTGGRRGKVGYGPNRVNPTTVAMTVQGHCNYLREKTGQTSELSVVVANDVRVFNDKGGAYRFLGDTHPLLGVSSRSLGKLACEVYAANGIRAYFAHPTVDTDPPPVLSTPMLSYAINELGADGGINLSASHNPPDDNGIKVYDEFGSQPVAPDDQHLADAMADPGEILTMPFEGALAQGLVLPIPESLDESYLQAYVEKFENVFTFGPNDPPIVYTPLCGCGLTAAGEVLRRLGVNVLTPPDQGPDGTFSVIPLLAPNPEVPQATIPAKEYADQHGARVVLSSDPDADRVGLEVKLPNDEWYHFDGNQISTLLAYFLMLDPDGPKRKGLLIETLVTTRILGKIVEKAGDSWIIDDILVGFKYVGDILKALGREGRFGDVECAPEDLVLAAEESHGVAILPTIRDKDSSPACMYLAALYQILERRGQSLLDYYCAILEELGGYDDSLRSIMMSGPEGVRRKNALMESLRANPPEALGGCKVLEMVDYWDQERFGAFRSGTDQLPRNVLRFITDAYIVAIRPSGTEPKLKFYCQQLPEAGTSTAKGRELLTELRERSNAYARKVYGELLARVGSSIGEVGLLLPDLVELEQKRTFENETIPELKTKMESGDFGDLNAALAWLRDQVAAMTPGADPLPAIKIALAHACGQWVEALGSVPLFQQLNAWVAAD